MKHLFLAFSIGLSASAYAATGTSPPYSPYNVLNTIGSFDLRPACSNLAVPAAAQAVGFTTLTLGPCVNIASGGNWRNMGQLCYSNGCPPSLEASTNSDGSVTIYSTSDGYNGQLETTQAFGGGMYIQATVSVSGPTPVPYWDGGSAHVWPAFWGFTTDGTTTGGEWNEPDPLIETDVMEEDVDSSVIYAATLHHYSENTNTSQTFGVPSGFGAKNTFGMLWVPATSGSQGYVQWYLNGQAQGNSITWNYGDTSLYGLLDARHLQFYLATSLKDTMTIYSVEAWQGPNGSVLTGIH